MEKKDIICRLTQEQLSQYNKVNSETMCCTMCGWDLVDHLTNAQRDLHTLRELAQLQQQIAPSVSDAKLIQGFPPFKKSCSISTSSIPSEKEHAPCRIIVADLPHTTQNIETVLDFRNTVYQTADLALDNSRYLSYSSEFDITTIVKAFMKDIAAALNLHFTFNQEVTVQHLRPDISVIYLDKFIVGVVEVKQPGRGVLDEPTVLGQLLDEMLLIEEFYGLGPAIGILTTGQEWRVGWFEKDTKKLSQQETYFPSMSYSTPIKQKQESKRHSPPGGTPSQVNCPIHYVQLIEDDSNEFVEFEIEEVQRELCVTPVTNIHFHTRSVIEYLSGALEMMSKSHLHHTQKLPSCLLKFEKNSKTTSFHSINYQDIADNVDYNRFPKSNTKNLLALEDLGRGATGKAWLCVTLTKPKSAACVLKFDIEVAYSHNLIQERDNWHAIYDDKPFCNLIKVEEWSGAYALVMPHFSTILEFEREQYRSKVEETLMVNFFNKNKVHPDVRWRNIGKYINRDGIGEIILYDLNGVVDYIVEKHDGWVGKAMKYLYGEDDSKNDI